MTRTDSSARQPRRGSSRRRVLGALGLGLGLTASLAGCTNGGLGIGVGVETGPTYEDGTVDVPDDAEERSVEEMATAEALAELESQEGVTPLDRLSIVDHEYVFEEGFRGSTVQGTVENTDDRVEIAEIRVRVYNDAGEQLGRYLDTTGDLDQGGEWAFEVLLLESPDDIASYEIAVIGTPT
ncbi:uncharacterized protein Nmag_2280 [Natrialba magadii ATCC 43099]|uniref:Uncharacterized protein n=1 Tax=Natrialba magadii (strain ATCC 43099 / DSM 3394 / CCM 3739 / CIP 104546 / IAM 13178 / JCM 8861 / NBRC 102185 / NCIMB 2190 / MS3) TaxID=547559 RepID=D3SWW3_NATMM|nr:FxLYD domain-containing protein [Natrialba magadii]ADD05845.1 uncharacterized protein Nmag_2280 [Natrialba magadii ATCC 43099]ELY30648.1 hypothetical protein C500_09012 [Natrialba magadii ATCC 43099]